MAHGNGVIQLSETKKRTNLYHTGKKNPKKLKTVIQKARAERRPLSLRNQHERMLLNVVKCALTRGAEWKASVEKVQLQHRAVLPASRRAFQLR